MAENSHADETLRARLAVELKRYFMISAYLFVCFSVILVYDASKEAGGATSALGLGAALVKALVLGKFILIGEALKPGTRVAARTIVHRVALRTVGMFVVLVVLKLLEELVIGWAHGQGAAGTVRELAGQTWLQLLGPALLMLLILIPLMTAIELDRALGKSGLWGLLRGSEGGTAAGGTVTAATVPPTAGSESP
jgi:hypothetical protein